MVKVDTHAEPLFHRSIDGLSVLLRLDGAPSEAWGSIFKAGVDSIKDRWTLLDGAVGIEGGHAVSINLPWNMTEPHAEQQINRIVQYVDTVEAEHARRVVAQADLETFVRGIMARVAATTRDS